MRSIHIYFFAVYWPFDEFNLVHRAIATVGVSVVQKALILIWNMIDPRFKWAISTK